VIDTLTRRLLRPDGVELAWDEWGDGRVPLVLVHGFSGSAHDFATQIDHLAAARRVAAMDNRGHGLSSKPDAADAYVLDLLVDDVAALLEVSMDGPVDLLGHSMGGRLALRVALDRPHLVRSLILMDTTAGVFVPEDEGLRELIVAYFESVTAETMAGLRNPGPEAEMIETATTEPWQALKAQRDSDFAPIAARSLGRQLFSADLGQLDDRLDEIQMPVTVIVGSEDHPFVDHAPGLASGLPEGQLTVIDGAYHSPQLTHPEEWRTAVTEHLRRADAG